MDCFHRINEIEFLIEKCCTQNRKSQLVLLEGNRHTGKTTLISAFLKRKEGILLTIRRSNSKEQLREVSLHLKSLKLKNQFIPDFTCWEEFFLFMFFLSKSKPVNLLIDDFHNLERIKPDSSLRLLHLWKEHAQDSRLNLIAVINPSLLGTEKSKTGLNEFKTVADSVLQIKEMSFEEVCRFAHVCCGNVNPEMLRSVYISFGGLPVIYRFLAEENLWSDTFENVIIRLEELKFLPLLPVITSFNELIPEKGRQVYTAILRAISQDITSVSKIGQRIGLSATTVNKYLSVLERRREVIKRIIPVTSPDADKSKYGRYKFVMHLPEFCYRFLIAAAGDSTGMEMEEKDESRFLRLKEYVADNFSRFISELLQTEAGKGLIDPGLAGKEIEIGPVWNRNVKFDTAFFDRAGNELKLLYFAQNSSIEIHRLAGEMREIQNHFKISRAELHIFCRNEDMMKRIKKEQLPYVSVMMHVGFPDELLYRKIVQDAEPGQEIISEGK